jgi:50S ribosomal subunit-associated GTPase HflX
VLNKLDRLSPSDADPEVVQNRVLGGLATEHSVPSPVVVSAHTGEGMGELLRRIDALLPVDPVTTMRFRVPHAEGAAVHLLHEYARVISKHVEEEYSDIVAETPESVKRQLIHFLAPER